MFSRYSVELAANEERRYNERKMREREKRQKGEK
jgi:hypothetical protein